MAEQAIGTEVNKNSTSYTSVVSPQKKRRKRKKRKLKKGSGARLLLALMVLIFHLDAKNGESEESSENLTRPALKFTRKCECASGILHPCHIYIFHIFPCSSTSNEIQQHIIFHKEIRKIAILFCF